MVDLKIVSLTCPNCGSAEQSIDQDKSYGYQFTCKNCGSTSVLIMNNRLYMPLPGEKVCITCGRVADRNSRFCQCGNSLVRKCINPECLKEFPVDHLFCDFCGWKQVVKPDSLDGDRQKFKMAIREYNDPEDKVRQKAREFVQYIIDQFKDSSELIELFEEMKSQNIPVNSFIFNILIHSKNESTINFLINFLNVDRNEYLRLCKQTITECNNMYDVWKALQFLEKIEESPFQFIQEIVENSKSRDDQTIAFLAMLYWIANDPKLSKFSNQLILTCGNYFSRLVDVQTLNIIGALGPKIRPLILAVRKSYTNKRVKENCNNILLRL